MKKSIFIVLIAFLALSCGEPPLQFSNEALAEEVIDLGGNTLTLSDVLDKYKGKKVLIDVWASWCGDCIQGMPKVKELQAEYNDVSFLFLSVDRGDVAWKRGIQRYNVVGDHYFLPKGQKGAFGDFLNSNWIPRYMVIDKDGSIKLYKAKKATDERIVEALK